MRTGRRYLFSAIILSILTLAACGENETPISLTTNAGNVSINASGGTYNLQIKTNAPAWKIENSASWLSISSTEGAGNTEVKLTISTKTLEPRSTTLKITAANATPVEVTVVQAASAQLYNISADIKTVAFKQMGESKNVSIVTDAPTWSVETDADWLTFNNTTGTSGTTTLIITAAENTTEKDRIATVNILATGASTLLLSIAQSDGILYPSYNTSPIAADNSGMTSNAVDLATKIKLGWNIGNTLEAIGGETAWGNPKVTKDLIDLVKANGFNAVRIPCSWDQYLENSSTAQLKASWLDRVSEVVQYCITNDMYVLLNIHWDGGWLENNCTPDKQEENNAKQKAFWEQIATKLRDYDEHLLFASANEPNVADATQMAVLASYHKTFINAVRSTGGKNSYRVLVVQGPSTDIDKTKSLMTSLPADKVADRLMVEVHFYTPWNFCGLTQDESWGKMFYYWGSGYHSTTDTSRNATWGEEATVDSNFEAMKTQFVDKGIPVILGEYNAMRRSSLTGDALTLHLASRAYYLKYVTKQARVNGILPFYWDSGSMNNNGSALFNRSNNTVFDQQALDAIIEGGK